MPIFFKMLQKVDEDSTLPNSFCETTITLMPKQKNYRKVNYRRISLMNIDAKILHKILASQIQHYIERIIQNDQVGFIQVM